MAEVVLFHIYSSKKETRLQNKMLRPGYHIYIYVYIYERKYHHEQKRPYLNQKVDRGDGDTRGKPILQQLVFKGIQSFACAHTLQAKKYSRVPKVSNDGFDHASHKGKPKTTTKMCYLVIKGICPCLVLF